MSKVAIIGGGAAGMMAAIAAARNGHQVTIYESNEKLGKKIYITGKGRCNITNACDIEEMLDKVVTNKQFLYSAIYGFHNYDMIDLLEELGCPVKIERGNRVFPVSDKSNDVIMTLSRELKRLNVIIQLHSRVENVKIKDGQIQAVELASGAVHPYDAVMVATGGLSYKSTGSTGDGYRFAKTAGHTVTDLSPSLVPFNIKETLCKELQGLSLRNIRMAVVVKGKEIYSDFGELLFTHFGISGPTVISASSYIQSYMKNNKLSVVIDLKPSLSIEQLDARLIRDFEQYRTKQFKNSLGGLLPSKLIAVIVERSGINPDKKVAQISKQERMNLITALKEFTLHISSLREYNEAIITKGGVDVKQINPTTMESKLISGLYFIGEVLDLDAVTGGFNLQIAWSTGYAAGTHVI